MANYQTFNVFAVRNYIADKLNKSTEDITNCNVHLNINNTTSEDIDISIWKDRYKRAETEGYYFLIFTKYNKSNNVYSYDVDSEHYIGYIPRSKIIVDHNTKSVQKISITITNYILWSNSSITLDISNANTISTNIVTNAIYFDDFEAADMDRNYLTLTKGEIAALLLGVPESSTSWINKLINYKNNKNV